MSCQVDCYLPYYSYYLTYWSQLDNGAVSLR
eukprot:COSAG06_NODE_51041_length_314_cov_1.679070_1_plen_30_part_01